MNLSLELSATLRSKDGVADSGSALRPKTLEEWLAWQQKLHTRPIELGLERVGGIAKRLMPLQPGHLVVTVAGTNGKGSCVALLESIMLAGGYRVGSYTSPHLLRYNERIRVQGREVSNEALCRAFDRVEQARGPVSLSYFEYGTLAAMHIFEQSQLDVALLEVGLGGRLDAVNVQDPDVAIITSIGIDHTDWLGHDRELIGREKAGIMRARTPVICGDPHPPDSIREHAEQVKARLFTMNEDYYYQRNLQSWDWKGPGHQWNGLPLPGIPCDIQLNNAATVLMALSTLRDHLPVSREIVLSGLRDAYIPGRFERLANAPVDTILDVAHNPAAAGVLADALQSNPAKGRSYAVFSALADKDVQGMVKALADVVDQWNLAPLRSERALSLKDLSAAVEATVGRAPVSCFDNLAKAYAAAARDASRHDQIIVFGSTICITEILEFHGSAFCARVRRAS